jgi:hypothetical protein
MKSIMYLIQEKGLFSFFWEILPFHVINCLTLSGKTWRLTQNEEDLSHYYVTFAYTVSSK